MPTIENPKIRGKQSLASSWYKFYPGFSEAFARSVLSSAELPEGAWVLDPWNGAGTTTLTAASLGLNALGYDLNPAMVIVSKARCLDPSEYTSLSPLSVDILQKARKVFQIDTHDPLLTWLTPRSVASFRSIEGAIQTLLLDETGYASIRERGTDGVSGLAAFFYVALFRSLKRVFSPFLTSNPTWLKRPRTLSERLRPSGEMVRDTFRAEVKRMLPSDVLAKEGSRAEKIIGVSSSEQIPLRRESVDYVLSSPPYCTRIDYAVATLAELSLLGYGLNSGLVELRRHLIGNATVPKIAPEASINWGATCLRFLDCLKVHSAKASATYYHKSHLQYFDSLARSMSEIARVLKPGGNCVLVVQDSYYKDIHNDLPTILTEMAAPRHLDLKNRKDFWLSRTMAGIHPSTREYRNCFGATESVLILEKQILRTEKVNHVADII